MTQMTLTVERGLMGFALLSVDRDVVWFVLLSVALSRKMTTSSQQGHYVARISPLTEMEA